ncbi:MAG: type II secretion system F family protein [Pirellulaceae bacterium]|nr:type II secretion system F family protein [Pirellulaceae bacterium]
MSPPSLTAGLTVTLDQLVALNDEMAALARAGVPLDQGLLHVGGDLPGKLGRISRELGRRLEAGETLEQVLSDASFPAAYRAVVAAGIRSGRLAVALEGVSAVLRRAAETRRLVAVSLVYPLLVITLAYSLFLFMVDKIFPVMLVVYEGMLPDGRGLGVLQWIERTAPHWLPWLPPGVLAILVLWWVRSRSVGRLENGNSDGRPAAVRRPHGDVCRHPGAVGRAPRAIPRSVGAGGRCQWRPRIPRDGAAVGRSIGTRRNRDRG